MEYENIMESFDSGLAFREEQIDKTLRLLKRLIRDKLLFQTMIKAGKKYEEENLSNDIQKELNRLVEGEIKDE